MPHVRLLERRTVFVLVYHHATQAAGEEHIYVVGTEDGGIVQCSKVGGRWQMGPNQSA